MVSVAIQSHPTERRAHPRKEVRWQAQWEAEGNNELGDVIDASAKGIFLKPRESSLKTLVPGSKVRLCLFTPFKTTAVDVKGVIRHSSILKGGGWGIEFDRKYDCIQQALFQK